VFKLCSLMGSLSDLLPEHALGTCARARSQLTFRFLVGALPSSTEQQPRRYAGWSGCCDNHRGARGCEAGHNRAGGCSCELSDAGSLLNILHEASISNYKDFLVFAVQSGSAAGIHERKHKLRRHCNERRQRSSLVLSATFLSGGAIGSQHAR